MTAPSLHAVRATRRVHRLVRVGIILVGAAAGIAVQGSERLTLAVILVVLLIQLLSLEELRVLALTFREKLK